MTVENIATNLGIDNALNPTADDMHQAIENLGADTQTEAFTSFLEKVEGTQDDGDDQLYGDSGDDLLFGMGGDDYLVGGKGEDILFGGAGNDIVVYDPDDFMVSGGSGIDFMVTADKEVTLDHLLNKSGRDDQEGPIVDGINVLLKGDDALSLTNMDQLASKYGITVEGNTIELGEGWSKQDGSETTYTFTGNDGTPSLTMEVNLSFDDQQLQVTMHNVEGGNV